MKGTRQLIMLASVIYATSTALIGPQAAAETLKLVEQGSLTDCLSKNAYPPMYWIDNGEFRGFDIDSLKAIADDLHLKVSYSVVAFDGLMPGLMSGRCDLLRSGLYVSEERKKKASVIPYLKTGPVMLVRKDDVQKYTKPDDFAGKTIAVQASSANKPVLDRFSAELSSKDLKPLKLEFYPTMPGVIAAVRNGKADALVETAMAATVISDSKASGVGIVDNIFSKSEETAYGMYFRPQDVRLREAILQSARKLAKEGVFNEIAKRYNISPSKLINPETIN